MPTKKKTSLQKLMSNIVKLVEENKGNIDFIGSFVIYDKNGEIKDDRRIAFGNKKTLKIILDDLTMELKKDKEKFINW